MFTEVGNFYLRNAWFISFLWVDIYLCCYLHFTLLFTLVILYSVCILLMRLPTSQEWPEEVYPAYANGPGYVLSSDIVDFIMSEFTKQGLKVQFYNSLLGKKPLPCNRCNKDSPPCHFYTWIHAKIAFEYWTLVIISSEYHFLQ